MQHLSYSHYNDKTLYDCPMLKYVPRHATSKSLKLYHVVMYMSCSVQTFVQYWYCSEFLLNTTHGQQFCSLRVMSDRVSIHYWYWARTEQGLKLKLTSSQGSRIQNRGFQIHRNNFVHISWCSKLILLNAFPALVVGNG